LHFSRESPLKSSRSVPLELAPGSETVIEPGGGGIEVTGRLVVDPPREPFDYHFSLTYLVAKRAGIDPPESLAEKGFDWRRGWSDSWFQSQEGGAYLNTLHNWFVKPDPDGRFRISGVPPGEYELAVNLYGTTEGCLVHPVAQRVVPIEVASGQSAIDLGTVVIPTQDVPQVGDVATNFEFTAPDGKSTDLAAQRGKYVLVDFWATWCGPCIAKLPEVEALREEHSSANQLVVIGANLDSEPETAREFLKKNALNWHHALLGDWSSTDVPKRYGISSVPAYVLVDPEGRISAMEYSLDKIRERLASVGR
jgi:thiol-disulfide isomerase/thioredoxin